MTSFTTKSFSKGEDHDNFLFLFFNKAFPPSKYMGPVENTKNVDNKKKYIYYAI